MSHELRTPLNAVLGFSEVLLERMFGDINERQEEYLRDIHGSGRHLLELLNEILDLSKVEAGRMELEHVASTCARCSTRLSPCSASGRPSRHRARTSRSTTTWTSSYADELRFKQVLLNLVTNAVKFTGDGGTVRVRRAVRRARRSGSPSPTPASGSREADRERIFESFQQGGRGAHARKAPGSA